MKVKTPSLALASATFVLIMAIGERAADLLCKNETAPRWPSASHHYRASGSISPMTIYNWEHGKTKPGKEQLAELVAVRKLGKREAERRWEMIA